jgi:hypothetical protein
MLRQWRKAIALGTLLGGLCLSAHANTTAAESTAQTVGTQPVTVETFAVDLSTTERIARIALLLPLQSDTLRAAAEAVRAGFHAAHEREPQGIVVRVVETGDAAQEVLSSYKAAGAESDIVVGPLSRSAVTTLIQNGAVDRPTIALAQPDIPGAADGAPTQHSLPSQLLLVGLSIEDEARQIANWADAEHAKGNAFVLYTASAWQRRAANAFEAQWRQSGREAVLIELPANDGFLNGRALLELKAKMQSGPPALMFLALDARQARQVRAILGDAMPLYGTSQINPVALPDRHSADRSADMDGVRLLDIPWQLNADHPAVMVYPRLIVDAGQQRSADLERLYALGIDAYRVAHNIAAGKTSFEIDGVTGKLAVHYDGEQPQFERTIDQAVYRDGGVVFAAAVR